MKHARLAPSAAARWMNCPGSIKLSAGIEETPSYYAAEGSAAHAVAEMCLRGGVNADTFLNERIGEQAIPCDPEMVAGVQQYLDFVRELMATAEDYEIETRLHATDEIFGTGDFVSYGNHTINVVDLKYGKGVAVDIKENPQLLTYALGAAKRYHNRGVRKLALTIVQPRASHRDGPVRTWVVDAIDVYEHAVALEAAAERVNAPEPELVPGPWCKFCRAAAVCPALAEVAMNAFTPMEEVEMYDADMLVTKLQLLPLVQTWCKRLEEFAHAEAVRGRMPAGYKLVDKRATRKWVDESSAGERLEFIGLEPEDIYETSLRSPAQIEKLLPKRERAVIAELAEARSSGTVLAPIDDPRPASESASASGFEAVEVEE
jgi:thiol-disulfide isomerase/thioredoxin